MQKKQQILRLIMLEEIVLSIDVGLHMMKDALLNS